MANYNDYLEYLKHIDNTTEQEITKKVNALSDEISNLKISLTNLNKVKDDLTTDLGNSRKQVNEKIDFINIKETELKKVSNDLNNVQKELKDTSFKLSELEKQHNIEQKKNATLTNEITELKSKYSVLENEVKTKNKSVNDYIAEIQKLHLDLENVKKDYTNSQRINSDLNSQIKKLKEDLNQLTIKYNSVSNSNSSNNKQLNDEIGKLNLELNQTKNSLESINKIKQTLQIELNDLKTKFSNSHNSNFEKEKSNLYQTIDKLNSQISNYSSQITNLKSDLKFKDDSLIKLKSDLDSKNKYLPYFIGFISGLLIMWFTYSSNFFSFKTSAESNDETSSVAYDTAYVEPMNDTLVNSTSEEYNWDRSDFLNTLYEKIPIGELPSSVDCGKIKVEGIGKENYDFEGYYKNNIPKFGRATFSDGSFYEGQFDDDGLRTGSGRKVWSDGEYYKGDFKKNQFEGYGVYVYKDGSRYEGQFSNSQFNGNGAMYYSNGNLQYKGYFKDGKLLKK